MIKEGSSSRKSLSYPQMITVFLLQDIHRFIIERLVHASNCAELTAHRASILVLGLTLVTDALCGFGIKSARPLCFPVKGPSCIAHAIVDIPCVRDLLGNICRVSRDLRGDNALLLRRQRSEEPDAQQVLRSKGRLHRLPLRLLHRLQM